MHHTKDADWSLKQVLVSSPCEEWVPLRINLLRIDPMLWAQADCRMVGLRATSGECPFVRSRLTLVFCLGNAGNWGFGGVTSQNRGASVNSQALDPS